MAGEVTGKVSIALPETFNELLIVKNGSSSQCFSIHIIKDVLTSTAKCFRSGSYYKDSKSYFGVNVTLTSVILEGSFQNDSDIASSTVTSVYYK